MEPTGFLSVTLHSMRRKPVGSDDDCFNINSQKLGPVVYIFCCLVSMTIETDHDSCLLIHKYKTHQVFEILL